MWIVYQFCSIWMMFFLSHIYHLWLLKPFSILFSRKQSLSRALRRQFGKDIAFKTECSNISHYQHTVLLWIFVLKTILYKRRLLWWYTCWMMHWFTYIAFVSGSYFIAMFPWNYKGGNWFLTFQLSVCFVCLHLFQIPSSFIDYSLYTCLFLYLCLFPKTPFPQF